MDLTVTQKLLIYGMTLFPLSEENQEAIFHSMKSDEMQLLMIRYLQTYPSATEQQILNEAGRIIKQAQQKQQKSSES